MRPAELAGMYSLGLDTIAGAKMLQVKFGVAGDFRPGQTVLHNERRARIIHISAGTAAIRYWGESDQVAVPPEALSLPTSSLPVRPLDLHPPAVRAGEDRGALPVPAAGPPKRGRRPVFGISR